MGVQVVLSIAGSVALFVIGLFVIFSGWLAIMQFRVEPEQTTRAAARGGWFWFFVGLALNRLGDCTIVLTVPSPECIMPQSVNRAYCCDSRGGTRPSWLLGGNKLRRAPGGTHDWETAAHLSFM